VFGIAPAFLTAREAPIEAIKAQGRGLVGEDRVGLPSGLVVLQIGLSLMLVVFAQLFIGSFQRLATRPLGFDSHGGCWRAWMRRLKILGRASGVRFDFHPRHHGWTDILIIAFQCT